MVLVGVESENGWRPAKVGVDSLVWVTVPGTNVNLQIQKGWPAKIMAAFAADYNAFVEPLRDPDSASYTPTNSVATSNHLNGTAMDLNWNSHPFRVKGTFSSNQMKVIRELLSFYENTIFWAGDWTDPIDEMHWQMGYTTWNNPSLGDFITRKIRPDGFSTFRRGNIVLPNTDVAEILSEAMGNTLSIDRYQQLVPHVQKALNLCQCTNTARIAMWLAQIGHESGGLRYMEEIASGDAYEGRSDLGNIYSGDGRKFKGRGPIQISGRFNYQKVSEWAFSKGLVSTKTYFVDNPTQLSSDTYGFLGVVWYWTVARSNINSMCDQNDLYGVTRAINGGTNGIQDRQKRWDRCKAMGSTKLLALLKDSSNSTNEGFLMALTHEQQIEILDRVRQLWGASFNPVPSKSRYGDPKDLWPSKDFDRNMDGFIFDLITEHDAALGDSAALERIKKAASEGDMIAHHFLEKLNSTTVPYSAPKESIAAIETSNNINCWKCDKNYPDILPTCPFCGSPQNRPEPSTQPVIPPAATTFPPVSVPLSDPIVETHSNKHEASSVPTDLSASLPPTGDLPTVNKGVVDQLSLLQRFNHQLPEEVSSAVNYLLPILKGLAQ